MDTLKYFQRLGDETSLTSSMIFAVIGTGLLVTLVLGSYTAVHKWRRWHVLSKTQRPSLDLSRVTPLPLFDVANKKPHPYRPWKAGKYNMTMGLRKMPEETWLIIDNLYEKEQELRRHLLETDYPGVMQCLPNAEEACEEALECVVNFMTRRYPSLFYLRKDKPGYIYNAITDRTFKVVRPYEQHPLVVAAQLTMEDINLLLQGTGEGAEDYQL